MSKQETCQERIQEHLDSRIEDLRTLWEAYQNGQEDVEDLGNIFEYGLAFDYVAPDTFTDQDQGYFRYQISYGGPSEEFRFYVDLDYTVYRIEFWFLDWYDGAKRILTGTDLDLMKEIYSWFHECGTTQAVYKQAIEA